MTIVTDKNMKTKDQLEYELQDAKAIFRGCIGRLECLEKLEILGQTPEQVYNFWRKNQIKMFKYQREMII